MRRGGVFVALAGLLTFAGIARGQTVITNAHTEMAGMWETDTIQVSPLANAQYPAIGRSANNSPCCHGISRASA